MFEFVCERVIPGCSHKETGDTPEAVREKAERHIHEHHGTEYLEGAARIDLSLAILRVQV